MKKLFCVACLLLLLAAQVATSQVTAKFPRSTKARLSYANYKKQGSKLQLWINNQSTLGAGSFDGASVPDSCRNFALGCTYPGSQCIEHLSGAGPFIASMRNGVPYVTMGFNADVAWGYFIQAKKDTIRNHLWHASIDSLNSANRKGVDDDGDFYVDEDQLDGIDNDGDWNPATDDLGSDGLPDSLETGCKGTYDPITNPDPAFDNYSTTQYDSCHPDSRGHFLLKNNKDIYTQNNGIPDHGEPHVDEDYGATAQDDYYCSFTDTTPQPQDPTREPQWVKGIQQSYSWKMGSAADGMVFFEYSFVNIGNNLMTDVYLGMMADMDVGPINALLYYLNNYAVYDRETQTAYVANPIDTPSTPLGLTFLGGSTSAQPLKKIFQWYYANQFCSSQNETNAYSCVSGASFPDSLIKRSQTPDQLGDVRVLLSSGPYSVLRPYDTVKAVYAFVSGMTIEEMLNNARRAHRIFEQNYFIMPNVSIADSGGSHNVMLYWNPVQRSPYGLVTSYRVYWGAQSGSYSDSLTTTDTSIVLARAQIGSHFFSAVRAIDQQGNIGAISDEVNNVPHQPQRLFATGVETSILLNWYTNTDVDLAGYNIYRKTSGDTTYIKINDSICTQTLYIDFHVRGDHSYTYKIIALDTDGNESPFSDTAQSHLIPPAMPGNIAVGPGTNYIYLTWLQNKEPDFAGYNIYRSIANANNYVQLNPALWHQNEYKDTTAQNGVYYDYYVVAVDTTLATSSRAYEISVATMPYSHKILLVDVSYLNNSTLETFYKNVFRDYNYTIARYPSFVWTSASTSLDLSQYSTVVWLQEYRPINLFDPGYPLSLKGHLLGGRNLIIMGRELPTKSPTFWSQFMNDYFGIDSTMKSDSSFTFSGAAGYQGFPNVNVDSVRLDSLGGRLNWIERFPNIPTERVLYRYTSNPFDPTSDGQPVGVRAVDSADHLYYLSFPLYYLDTTSARALVHKLLDELGEPLGIVEDHNALPHDFELMQNYPNPFNPSTTIRFSIPEERFVSLKIFDLLGREITTLVNEQIHAGVYSTTWNANNYSGGIYYCRISATDKRSKSAYSQTIKLMLVK